MCVCVCYYYYCYCYYHYSNAALVRRHTALGTTPRAVALQVELVILSVAPVKVCSGGCKLKSRVIMYGMRAQSLCSATCPPLLW